MHSPWERSKYSLRRVSLAPASLPSSPSSAHTSAMVQSYLRHGPTEVRVARAHARPSLTPRNRLLGLCVAHRPMRTTTANWLMSLR